MTMRGILRPGHCQVRVLDLEESINFYTNVFGLVETGRDASGRVYFKTHDERDHNSFIIREADRAGGDFYGFKVYDKATMEQLEADLNAYGIKTERIPAGELLETGERVRFEVPTGHHIELYYEKTCIGDGRGYKNPDVIIEDRKGISPVRMDHWQLHGADLDGTLKVFTEVLGFSLVEKIVDEKEDMNIAVWLTCSCKAHDIAFVRDERNNTMHHTSFLLETWEQVLHAADLMGKHRVSIDNGPLRHGITRGTTIYSFDPSGNRLETFCGGYDYYPDMQPYVWTTDELGAAIFYHTRALNERFLTVVT